MIVLIKQTTVPIVQPLRSVQVVNRSKLVQRFKVRFGKGELARFDNSQNVKISISPPSTRHLRPFPAFSEVLSSRLYA